MSSDNSGDPNDSEPGSPEDSIGEPIVAAAGPADDEDDNEPLVTVTAVEADHDDDDDADDDESALLDAEDPTEQDVPDDEEEDEDDDEVDTVRSHLTEDEVASTGTPGTAATGNTRGTTSTTKETPPSAKRTPRRASVSSIGGSSAKRGRAPSVAGLTIPFRTVKKAMKLDPDTPIVQNEAAIMTTMAAELFLKSLAKESFRNAKHRGRNTIRYEDVAEARTKKSSLAFLETLLP